jgi:hypothetical protein
VLQPGDAGVVSAGVMPGHRNLETFPIEWWCEASQRKGAAHLLRL